VSRCALGPVSSDELLETATKAAMTILLWFR